MPVPKEDQMETLMTKQELKAALGAAKNNQAAALKAVQDAAPDTPQKTAAQQALEAAEKAVTEAERALEEANEDNSQNGQSQKKTGTRKPNSKRRSPAKSKSSRSLESGEVFEVTCAHARRRGGVNFGPVPVRIDPSELNKDQIKAIENDPLLKVKAVD